MEYIRKRQAKKAANGTINRELALLKEGATDGRQVAPRGPDAERRDAQGGSTTARVLHACGVRAAPTAPRWRAAAGLHVRVPGRLAEEEVFLLEWKHVELDAHEITLPRELSKNAEGRTIKLAGQLEEIIRTQATGRPDGCSWVFHRNGRHIKDFREPWLKALREAGLEAKTFHDFRGTAVRNMVRSGIPERVAMKVSGHKTRDVFDRYDIVGGDDLSIDTSYRAGSLTVSLTPEKQTAEKSS